MASLSSYDKGKKCFEGRRYQKDIEAAKDANSKLFEPLRCYNKHRRSNRKRTYQPETVILEGNHEYRISKAVEAEPILSGTIDFSDLSYENHYDKVCRFLEVIELDGILYSHYFPRSANGRVMQTYRGAPSARVQVQREMQSSTAGHQQGLDFHVHQTGTRRVYGLIAGSCYPEDFDYLSPQGTAYWRGIIVKHNVDRGMYSPMFVDLDYLEKRYG